MANTIVTEIVLDLDTFKAQLKNAENQGKDSGSQLGKNFGSSAEETASKYLSNIKSLILGIGAALGAGFVVKNAVRAAEEQQDAINSLNNALALNGNYTDAASQKFQNFAERMQGLTTVQDDVIVKGGALLATLGRLSGDGLERASKAALDLSAGLGIDVNNAFELLAKASTGHVGILNRYGIKIKETGDASRDFAKALDLINQRVGGLAESKVNTFSGATAQLSNNINKLFAELGKTITESPAFIALIKAASKAVAGFADTVKNGLGNTDIFGTLIKSAIQFGQYFAKYVIVPIEFLWTGLKNGVLIASTAFLGLVTVFAFIGEALTKYIINPFIDFASGAVAGVVGIFNKDMAAQIKSFADETQNTLSTSADATAQKYAEITAGLAANTTSELQKGFNFDASIATETLLTNMQEVVDTATPAIQTMANQMTAPIQSMWSQIGDGLRQKLREMTDFVKGFVNTSAQAFQMFSAGIGRGFQQVGTNLAQGQSAFKNFGNIMLGVLGDIAIQFGQFFLLIGIGKALLGDPTGGALIAAGIALNILGGVLKALSGGAGLGAGAGAGGAGGGGGAEGGGVGATAGGAAGDQLALQDQKPQTQVAVNIQGNILDRRQTGLEIVEIINESFGTNDVKFAVPS